MYYYGPDSVQNLDAILLDDGIGKHVVRGGLDFLLRLLAGDALGYGDIEELTLAHVGDAVIAESVESRTDRLSLRVEHRAFQRDENASFHGNFDYRTTNGPERAPEIGNDC